MVNEFSSPKGVKYSFDGSIASEEVVGADIWVLREAVKALRNECQRGRVDQFVEDQLKDLI